jgi:hypothetical protein
MTITSHETTFGEYILKIQLEDTTFGYQYATFLSEEDHHMQFLVGAMLFNRKPTRKQLERLAKRQITTLQRMLHELKASMATSGVVTESDVP